ncbi:MAG: hypothetical protein ACRECD_01790, partial [Burkholderiaceae bacterium]
PHPTGFQLADQLPPLEQAVVRFVQELRFDHLDDAAHAGVSRLMRDQLALQIGTSQMPWSRQVLAFASAQQRPGRCWPRSGEWTPARKPQI